MWLLWRHVRAPSVVAFLFSPWCVTSAVHHPLWRLPGRAGVYYVQTPSLRSGHRQCLVGRPFCPPFLDFRSIRVTCRDLFLGECRCNRHLEPHLGLDALWGPFLKGCLVRTRTRWRFECRAVLGLPGAVGTQHEWRKPGWETARGCQLVSSGPLAPAPVSSPVRTGTSVPMRTGHPHCVTAPRLELQMTAVTLLVRAVGSGPAPPDAGLAGFPSVSSGTCPSPAA